MKKVIKIIIILLLIVALIIGGIFIFKKFMNKPDDSKEPMVVEIKKLDEIKGFSYYLYDNSTELYKELFNELKTVLEADTIDESKYAEELLNVSNSVIVYNLLAGTLENEKEEIDESEIVEGAG